MYGSVSRLIYLSFLYEQIKDVKGAIVECGVGWGNSLLLLGFLLRQERESLRLTHRRHRNLYGFDSFELGYPEPHIGDSTGTAKPKKGDWKTTQTGVRKLFQNSRCGVNPVLISGFFSDTLSKLTSPVAFVHIDCDLYEAYKEVMEHFYPLMEPGAIMTFDEYGSERWPGATYAVEEFLLESGEQLRVYEPLHLRYIVKGAK